MGRSDLYQKVTRYIQVTVEPDFLENQSKPQEGYFFWAYTITIENTGSETVVLQTRHWRITDGQGRVQEVSGPGVVGEHPRLRPGGSFKYTSGAPLQTPSGFMAGSYTMETDTGEQFDVEIPAFSLDCPHGSQHMH